MFRTTTKFVQITSEEAFRPRGALGAELIEPRRFEGLPVERAKRRGVLGNVAAALGNVRATEAVPLKALRRGGGGRRGNEE